MKILYVTTNSNTVNAFLVPHIKFLVEQGNEVDVACNIIQLINNELLTIGCKVHPVEFQRSPLKKENITAYKKVKEIIQNEKYDLIHVHTPVASFITRFACRKNKNVRVLYTAHGFHFYKGAPKVNWLLYYTIEKFAARWTDTLITMNDEDYEAAKKMKMRNGNSVFKVNGVGLNLKKFLPQTKERKERLRIEYGFEQSELILIYVGELSYRKRQDLLIEAVGLLKEEIPNLKLLLVGDGDLMSLYKKKVQQFEVNDQVVFMGYRKDVAQLMTLSDIAVSSSRQEGLPVNIIEAMATGLPIIVTDCRGNRDLISNGVNGLIVGEGDVFAFAKEIKELYYSETLRKACAKKNRECIQNYAIEKIIGDLDEVYNKHLISIKSHAKNTVSQW
ncbi:glycosyltransferase family 4 protein [Bacillus sp. UMB0728]|uniref:glycosyltransferase family 4 protein n=1 Tax=Bacillus sp. UMB0728 TaxID=2066052 RepID=UPI000C761EB8|nr:glycosyltransferase family 4 protein [Bacillus sp. UMB0728]PLR73527.1 glycosyltransferase family 1 protein [Bacillus sp. UMB0728]